MIEDPEMVERRKRRILVNDLLMAGFVTDRHRPPGTVIQRLSPERRELCKTLTAEDFQHWIWGAIA